MRIAPGLVLLVVAIVAPGHASDPPIRHLTIPVSRLEILEGTLPPPPPLFEVIADRPGQADRVVLDGGGDVEWVVESRNAESSWDRFFLIVRTNQTGLITGRMFRTDPKDPKQVATIRFRIPADANTNRAHDWFQFARAKRLSETYTESIRRDRPGTPWFRHQLARLSSPPESDLAFLWREATTRGRRPNLQPAANEPDSARVVRLQLASELVARQPGTTWSGDLTELFSGGRAISENLQLNRALNVRDMPKDGEPIAIASIPGITVREFDWSARVPKQRPELDPLAERVPADQHVAFFPSVAATLDVFDELDRTGLGILQLSAARSIDSRIGDRYKTQLAIPKTPLGRLIPVSLVSGVAVTGGDLYFDTGTDVALLFQTERPAAVATLLTAHWPKLKADEVAIEADIPLGDGERARFLSTADRRVSAYLLETNGAVILTNSLAQLGRLCETQRGRRPALAASLEYVYFRGQYKRGDPAETGFVLLPDAAIRRWCGPQWRIAHHRRILQGGAVAAAQAEHLLAMSKTDSTIQLEQPGLGPIQASAHGVFAPAIGTHAFLTPIIEHEIVTVSPAEKLAYDRWRESYQQNWSQFFDPIAVRITARPERVGLDVTVMPLILNTAYRRLADWSIGAKLQPGAGDPHPEELAQLTIGFNRESASFRDMIEQVDRTLGVKLSAASWLGDWFTIYADQDELWEQFLRHAKAPDEFWRKNQYRIPLAVALEVRDPLKLAIFLTALKAFINVTAPNLIEWKPGSYRDVGYVAARGQGSLASMTVYSVPLPDQWIITLHEGVLKRAIDRHLARKANPSDVPAIQLGASARFTVKSQAVAGLQDWWGRATIEPLQQACWANIPILNEWHALGQADPVAFHERWWGDRLLCPLGGKYVWNATDGTMESTLLGHPGRPKVPENTVTPFLRSLRDVQMGVTIEAEGLRARLEATRGEK